MSSPSPVVSRRGQRTLLMIFGLSLIPVLLATGFYYFGTPRTPQTYGQLLLPIEPATEGGLRDTRGQAATLASLGGKWLLVTVGDGACDALCRQQVHAARQIRLAQGKELDRVRRVWLVSDATDPAKDLPAEDQEELTILNGAQAPLLKQLAKHGDPRGALFVIDPHGNLVFRYGPDADPNKVLREVGKLLKNSGIG